MTVENCLRLAKELGDLGNSQESLLYLNRARSKVERQKKYAGKKVVGFELVKDKPAPKPKPKQESKNDGKKSKR